MQFAVKAPRGFDHGTDEILNSLATFFEDGFSGTPNHRRLGIEFANGAHQGHHDLDRNRYAPSTRTLSGFDDGAGLHFPVISG